MTIDLDTIKIKKDRTHKDTIKIDDNLTMKMKYPSMDNFIESNFDTSTQGDDIKTTLEMIVSCIDTIYTEEESWLASESTTKELEDFVYKMNTKQFKMIEDFFATMPKLTHSIKVKNPTTEVESTVVLEGLAAFFN